MPSPLFSVIIPTRERADTLRSALRSCIGQSFKDTEFIVSNNASKDDTEAVVQSFDDPRIRLINTGHRVSMRENWEFALDHVTGRYVMFIGDDDAIVPEALSELANIVATHNVKAVKWQAPTYFWPHEKFEAAAGHIAFTPVGGAAYVNSSAAINALKWGYLAYHHLPMVYHGLAEVETIRKIQSITGEFFRADSPDIYSGIALAAATTKYLYIAKPLTISGASQHSTGTSMSQSTAGFKAAPILNFIAESTVGLHPQYFNATEAFSLQAAVTDALLRVRDEFSGGKLFIPLWYRLLLVVREACESGRLDLASPGNPIHTYCEQRYQLWLYHLYIWIFARQGPGPTASDRLSNWPKQASRFVVDTKLFGIEDAYGASVFLGKLLHQLDLNIRNPITSTRALVWGRLSSKISTRGVLKLFTPTNSW